MVKKIKNTKLGSFLIKKLIEFNRKRFPKQKQRIYKLYDDLYKNLPLETFRDIHKNKRCFLIGNGPSLKFEDLELVSDEITFCANKIYKVFDKTHFRPYYYVVNDEIVATDNASEILKVPSKQTFIGVESNIKCFKKYINENVAMYKKSTKIIDKVPMLSDDFSKYIGSAHTVLFSCFQLAVLMGIKEIYLIGVDCSYSSNNNTSNWFYGNENSDVPSELAFNMIKSYESIRTYAEKNDIKVYNATRGGQLDVFERIDLENVFKK